MTAELMQHPVMLLSLRNCCVCAEYLTKGELGKEGVCVCVCVIIVH